MLDKEALWKEVLEGIRVSVSPAIFQTWFLQTHIHELSEGGARFMVEVGCGSAFVKTTLETRYSGLVYDSLVRSLGKPCDVIYIVKSSDKKLEDKIPSPLFSVGSSEENLSDALTRAKIRPGFTFSNFAVSSSNQMAHAAAQAVAESPGSSYNPLFIWGGVGVGKTHLMLAVGHELLKKDGAAKILFVTGEGFTNDIVEGIRNKTTPAVRDKYRKLKALFIDDIQFIAGKDTVQEEFFHTFNAITSAGGQIILTSDKPPSEISRLEERLRSRFEAGLIVDVAPPDFELRSAILQIKSKERGIELTNEAVSLIAANFDSARKIEGFLIRLASEAKLKRVEITDELVQSLVEKGGPPEGNFVKVAPDAVVSATSEYFAIGKRNLLGESRQKQFALPRQILMYLLRTQLQLPFEEVGRLVGRDHTTVMHAVEKITHLASIDVQIREYLLGIKGKI